VASGNDIHRDGMGHAATKRTTPEKWRHRSEPRWDYWVREGSCPIQRNTGLQCLRLRPPADVWPLERSVGHLSNPLLDQGQRPELRLAIGLGDVADRLRDHCMDGG